MTHHDAFPNRGILRARNGGLHEQSVTLRHVRHARHFYEATCLTCARPFGPRRGGARQRFCCPRHRVEFHTAARVSDGLWHPNRWPFFGMAPANRARFCHAGKRPPGSRQRVGRSRASYLRIDISRAHQRVGARVPHTQPTIAAPMRRNEHRFKIPTGHRQTWWLKASKPDRPLAWELVP
jgi:hypothetical protein